MGTKTATRTPRIKQAAQPKGVGGRLADLRELAMRYNRIGAIADARDLSFNEAARAEGAEYRRHNGGQQG